MPLGKLSRAQIEKAYAILSRVELLLREENVNRAQFVDVSNQFYTLIPHDFGTKAPPLLDNEQLVKVYTIRKGEGVPDSSHPAPS